MHTAATCPKCGAVVPADAPAGLCPQCLLAAGLAAPSSQACLSSSDQPPGPEEKATTADWPAGPEGPPQQPTAISEQPGSLIAGRYQLLEPIGHGGMGVVWRAHDLQLNREVAVKLLRERRAADSPTATRFRAEGQLTAQLQHPGIPAVHELGTLPDGRPFLALKLVKGQTLANLLQGRDRERASDDRGQFLAIFEQVCHAVGYAHAHHVIHRDLKPSNVMVGAFGEVQVMDWGLAKVLDDTSTPRQQVPTDPQATVDRVTAMDTPERGDLATRTGSVLGTPAYMPPEQAGGEVRRLDARSDVFGLGAILCQILTGRPPYRSSDANQVRLQAVRGETAEAFAALDACGAEPDLIALCKRCLAFKQEDRPADGTAVAQEVARIRHEAEARARQAEMARARAEVAAAEQGKRRRLVQGAGVLIAAVLLIGLAASLWQMNRAIYAEAQAVSNAELAQTNEAKAIQERDAKDAALKAEQKALAAKSAALEAERQARQAEKEARDRAMAALRLMTDEMVEHQLARNPTLTEANKAFLRKVIKHFEGFAAITANDADSRAIRAEGYARVGLMRHRLGELKEAEAAYRDALTLYKQLVADFPTDPRFRDHLAAIHNNLGNLLHDTGRLKQAEAALTDALAIYKQLAADFPTVPVYRQDLATSHNDLALLLDATGRLKEAEAAYREALAIQKRLAADFPTRPEFRETLAHGLGNLGKVLLATGRLKEAEAAYREALAIQKRLAADFPARPDYRQDLAKSHTNLGIVLEATNRLKEAEAAWREALTIQKQLAAEFPTRPDFREQLATCYSNLVKLLGATGRLKEAVTAGRDALAIRKQLAAEFPTRPDFRQDLAQSLGNLGLMLGATGDLKEAEAAFTDALALQKQLVAEFPTRSDFRQELARCHYGLGLLLRDTGRPQEAEAAWREALAIQKQLAAEFPNNPDLRNNLAGTLVQLAMLRWDFAAAKKYLTEAEPHHLAALKANPRNPTYRLYYHNNLFVLTQAQAGLLDQAAAVQAAQTLRDLDWGQPSNTYDAACALALCIPIVQKHEKLDAEKRKAAVQFYGDKAMEMLRLAVEKGWKNAAHMEKDSDLDPLRSRADFQKLLQELDRPR
jgi:tetratricopeptide (TPR) repeat protein